MNINKEEIALTWANRADPKEMNKLTGYFMEMASQIAYTMRISSFYKEDYIQTAAVHALHSVNKYDPKKMSNPFSYFYKVIMMSLLYELRRDKLKRDKSGNICSWDKLVNATKDKDFSYQYDLAQKGFEERLINVGKRVFTYTHVKKALKEAKKLVKSEQLIMRDGKLYSQKSNVYIEKQDELKHLIIEYIIEAKQLMI